MNPIAAIVVTLVLLALFIGLLIGLSLRARRRRSNRRLALAAEAATRGWAYEARHSGVANAFGSKPFRRGRRRRHEEAMEAVSGLLGAHRAVAFLYRYSAGTNPENLSQNWVWFTVCAVQLPPELGQVPPERKSFQVDRGNPMVRQVMRGRIRWLVDGNWLLCWQRGANVSAAEIFARLTLLAAIVDGQAGRVVVT
jgi:hypothetical protein